MEILCIVLQALTFCIIIPPCRYFFYKNTVYTFTQFWFNLQTGFSGQRFYEDWYQSFYNLVGASSAFQHLHWSGVTPFRKLHRAVGGVHVVEVTIPDNPNYRSAS